MSVVSATSPSDSLALTPARVVLLLIVVSGLLRIALAATIGLGFDESYSVANARTLSLSYVDHPPLHLWIAGLAAKLAGTDHPLVVRLPFILMFAGTTWLMFCLTALLFGERAGVWAALLLNMAPQLTLAAASWVLPDGPLDFFLVAAAYVVVRILFAGPEPSRAIAPWIAAGVLGGFAVLAKYHGAFLFLAVFVFLLAWRPVRPLLATPGPWLGVAVAALMFAPVVVWNIQNDWVGLYFHTRRVAQPSDISVTRVLVSLAAQSAYLLPWIMVPLAVVWVKALAAGTRRPPAWFLALLASGPIVVFTLANLFRRGLPHWPIPGWLMALPLLGVGMVKFEERWPRFARAGAAGTFAALVLILGALGLQAATGAVGRTAPILFARNDPTLDLLDWRGVREALAARGLLGEAAAVAGPHWMDAGKLNYAMGQDFPVLCLCADPQHFRFLRNASDFAGRTIIIVARRESLLRHRDWLMPRFGELIVLDPLVLERGGAPALSLTVVRGTDFRP